MPSRNPFEYEQAHLIPDDLVAQYYIDDHNYGRLIQSKKNVFLIGERGSGKTMTLLYNTLGVQRLRALEESRSFSTSLLGALVPANTPLTHRREHRFLDDFQASVVSEHFLALAIVFHLSDALRALSDRVSSTEGQALREEMTFMTGVTLPESVGVFDALCQAAQKENVAAQRALNTTGPNRFYEQSLSFGSLVVPFLRALRKMSAFADTHFMLMIDDAHSLNAYQVRALNSWIAYRDRELFSFKVATAKVGRPTLSTSSGGDILEGHDFLTIDMERSIHNEDSDYGKFAEKVVRRRLRIVMGGDLHPDVFFPVHEELARGLEEAEAVVRARAAELFPNATPKQVTDYVYKQKRSEYFRSRGPRANRPPYSGFSMLVYLSTGVIRNLLEPCWWMWDAVVSQLPEAGRADATVELIPPGIQADTVIRRSEVAWERLKNLDMNIDGCSHEDGSMVFNLFDQLAVYFRERLLTHPSEPGATSFSISARDASVMGVLQPLLDIAQKAQLLYVREGPAKDRGRREPYYVPNRILWPVRGLDPHGQHARASIKAIDLLNAARGQAIPVGAMSIDGQVDLFGEPSDA